VDNSNPKCKSFLMKLRLVATTIKKYNSIALLIVLCIILLPFQQTRGIVLVAFLPLLILIMYTLAMRNLTSNWTKFSDVSMILSASINGLTLYLSYLAFGDAFLESLLRY